MVVDVGNFLQIKELKLYDTMLKILDFALLILMRPQKERKKQLNVLLFMKEVAMKDNFIYCGALAAQRAARMEPRIHL